jgi:hypothetical protein
VLCVYTLYSVYNASVNSGCIQPAVPCVEYPEHNDGLKKLILSRVLVTCRRGLD